MHCLPSDFIPFALQSDLHDFRKKKGVTMEASPKGPANASGSVAKMASHAIFQYNVLVIDINNTTLGLI